MSDSVLSLTAHLMRRAGFGATRGELEEYASRDYDDLVDELLDPDSIPDVEEDVLQRYYPELTHKDSLQAWSGRWIYRMVNSRAPLRDKMALFWHQVFATAWHKSEHTPCMIDQIESFRRVGMSDLRTILLELSRDPGMVFWLDNCENFSAEPNENYGRELLELFSMGVGNYTEQDLKMAARAFTGWTFAQPIPLYPYGHYEPKFKYVEEEHDGAVKTFLGETGRLDGEDILDIIVRQPATARFIARHLYNFFVADEAQVPAWGVEPPNDPDAIEALAQAYFDYGGDIREMLRVLFKSDFFKKARFKRVKNPAELIAGTIKLVGTHRFPEPGLTDLVQASTVMGQELMNPPTVEGWHTGREWVNGGTLNARVNFAVDQVGDVSKPGIQEIVSRLEAVGPPLSPDDFVDRCIELAGPLEVGDETRASLVGHAAAEGELRFDTEDERKASAERVARILQLIVAVPEYQMA